MKTTANRDDTNTTLNRIPMLAIGLLSEWPPDRWRDRRLLLGVSGGADSIALLLALHELADSNQLVVAHFNHGWRGKESDDDCAFVVKLSNTLGRPCITQLSHNRDSLPTGQSDSGDCRNTAMLAKAMGSKDDRGVHRDGGDREDAVDDGHYLNDVTLENKVQRTEENARRLRYNFFKETAYRVGASYIVTAHTADDRIETLLHNMLRGSGLAGAASLVMFRAFDEDLVLARPLLRKRRVEIESFLAERGQCYRHDSSNDQTRYKRNFVRRELLPLITQHYPSASNSLLNFSELAEELMADCDDLAQRWLVNLNLELASGTAAANRALLRWPGEAFFLASQNAFQAMPWSIVQTALRSVWEARQWPLADMTRLHWQAVRELAGQTAGVVNLPASLRAEVAGGFLAIGPANSMKGGRVKTTAPPE